MLGDIVVYNGQAAIVVKVNKHKTVNLQVFNDGNSVTYVADVPVDEIEVKGGKK